jgi:hypothetical protein
VTLRLIETLVDKAEDADLVATQVRPLPNLCFGLCRRSSACGMGAPAFLVSLSCEAGGLCPWFLCCCIRWQRQGVLVRFHAARTPVLWPAVRAGHDGSHLGRLLAQQPGRPVGFRRLCFA